MLSSRDKSRKEKRQVGMKSASEHLEHKIPDSKATYDSGTRETVGPQRAYQRILSGMKKRPSIHNKLARLNKNMYPHLALSFSFYIPSSFERSSFKSIATSDNGAPLKTVRILDDFTDTSATLRSHKHSNTIRSLSFLFFIISSIKL